MNLADDAPAAGATLLTALSSLATIVIAAAKWLQERERAKAMRSVPPTKAHLPSEAEQAASLSRLRSIEDHHELTGALSRARWRMDDLELRVAELERENERLATQLKIERTGRSIANDLLRAKDEALARMRDELTKARARSRGAMVVEISAAEHRDASLRGDLQDALKTPLRPPPKE